MMIWSRKTIKEEKGIDLILSLKKNSGDTILNYLLNAGMIQPGIKYGCPRI